MKASRDHRRPLPAARGPSTSPGTRPRARLVRGLGAAAAAMLAALLVLPGGRHEARGQGQDGAPGAFGFVYGEERRYEMGPQDHLGAGEAATWSIRLEEVHEASEARFATFVLTHEYAAAPPRSATFQQGELVSLRFEGRMTVNADGFPVDLGFETTRDLFGLGQQTYSVDYVWTDEHFVKTVRMDGQEWEVVVGVPGHEHLDRSVPTGAHPWLASGLRCMGRKPVLNAFGRLETVEYCTGGEWAFANPGLLGLVLPALYEAGGERDFLFFGPTGPDPYEGLAGTVTRGRQTRSGAFGRPPTAGDVGRARDPWRYFESAGVRFDERVEVEVGDRTLEVWRLEADGPVRAIYLDDDDRVVRVDVDAHPVSNRARWIRLLFPSEF